jgi:hypothetical protein
MEARTNAQDSEIDLRHQRESLRAIAIAKLAEAFYGGQQLTALAREFSALKQNEQDAIVAHKTCRDTRGAEREEINRLWDLVTEAVERVKAFRMEHPLISELTESRDALCKRDHMGRLA